MDNSINPESISPATRERRSQLAVASYERVAAEIARRAGQQHQVAAGIQDALIAAAENLALPKRAGTVAAPVLTSLAGRLNGGSQVGYSAPHQLDVDPAGILSSAVRPERVAENYAALWPGFARERNEVLAKQTLAREAAYHALLQRYAWAMPAPGDGDSNVSLFDFARVTAALAVCLDGREEPATAEDVALLIGGDLSGVQDWLYTLGSIGAAKSLRGRSFYLQLLCEIVALHLIDALGLPDCNLLYVGGGNFYLLAPPSAAGQLDHLQQAITHRLLAMHGGALYLALGSTVLTRKQLAEARAGEAWGRVNQAMGERKRKRFAELDDVAMFQAIGSPLEGTGKLEDTCAVCRRPIQPGEATRDVRGNDVPDELADQAQGRVCELCMSFEELGNRLRNAAFLTVAPTAPQPGKRVMTWWQGLVSLGYDVHLLDPAGPQSGQGWQPPPSKLARVYYWSELAEALRTFPGNPDPATTVWAYRPLAQAVPFVERSGQIATFEQLHAEGIQRWGVLRMDVDNLGRIFQQGLPDGSLSRIAALSALLRQFFEGYVPQLVDAHNKEDQPAAYLMYAGGDDLFIVAGWSHLPEIAWEIRQALSAFTGGNPQVTISGGIAIAPAAAFPIYQAARLAGRAEDKAKDAGKNRLTFLDQAVVWVDGSLMDLRHVRQRIDQVKPWIARNGPLNRSFLMRLRSIDAEWHTWRQQERSKQRRYQHANQVLYLGPWQWHLVYSLRRAVERKDEALKDNITRFVNDIVAGEIAVLGLEARWTELLTREKQDRSESPLSAQKEVA